MDGSIPPSFTPTAQKSRPGSGAPSRPPFQLGILVRVGADSDHQIMGGLRGSPVGPDGFYPGIWHVPIDRQCC